MEPMPGMAPAAPAGGAPHTMGHSMMRMTFQWGVHETILFDGWKTTTCAEFLAACVAVVCMSVAMRICKSFITHPQGPFYRKMSTSDEVSVVLMYGIVATLSYLLMLIAMTFNAGLFLSVVIGQMIGFYIVEVEGRFAGDRQHVHIDAH